MAQAPDFTAHAQQVQQQLWAQTKRGLDLVTFAASAKLSEEIVADVAYQLSPIEEQPRHTIEKIDRALQAVLAPPKPKAPPVRKKPQKAKRQRAEQLSVGKSDAPAKQAHPADAQPVSARRALRPFVFDWRPVQASRERAEREARHKERQRLYG